jgi:hypothetical protein
MRNFFSARRPIPKNVFVLCTGRCGSTTFIQACTHITNFSAGHETRTRLLFDDRINYPPNHIEADNRLSWMLGRMHQRWGREAYYVHLVRDREEVAKSFERRLSMAGSIISAHNLAVLMKPSREPLEVCLDYVDTITENIRHFLSDKPNVMTVRLETAQADFEKFWHWIGATGDLPGALSEWQTRHNAFHANSVPSRVGAKSAPER